MDTSIHRRLLYAPALGIVQEIDHCPTRRVANQSMLASENHCAQFWMVLQVSSRVIGVA